MGEVDEAELVSAGQRGAVIDGMADGDKRTVQAALLRRCCHELKDRIDPRGLRLTNVNVLWWLNLATLLGWLLSSIFVLSLARLSRST
jgi:hypothetical protein